MSHEQYANFLLMEYKVLRNKYEEDVYKRWENFFYIFMICKSETYQQLKNILDKAEEYKKPFVLFSNNSSFFPLVIESLIRHNIYIKELQIHGTVIIENPLVQILHRQGS